VREVWLRISAAALVALLISGLLPVVTLAAVPDTTADAATVAEDGSVNIPVLDNDSTDAGALSVTAVTNPSDGTATIAGDGLSVDYLPDPNFHGSDSFTYVATNDDGDSLPTTVSITVTSVNDPPVADNDAATVLQDAAATPIPVLVGDTDPDGDTLTIDSAVQPANGTVVVAGNGLSLTYKPDPNFHGIDTFTYLVTDGILTDQGTVTITVTPVNHPPVADNDSGTVLEDAAATTIPVLAGDTDPDGDVLTIDSASNPPHGTVVVASNGLSLTYKPDPNFHGIDTFTYVVTDGFLTDQGTVTITVTSVNDPPVADNDSATVLEDAAATTIPVLAGDIDPDGDTLTIDSAVQPANGTVVVAPNGLSLTYKPDPNFHGIDTFAYLVTDGILTDQGTVTITVTSVNDPPTVVDESTSVAEDSPKTTFFVLQNDSDIDGDTVTIFSASNPPNGTAIVASDKLSLTYQPDSGYSGPDSFTYVVTDGVGGFTTGTVTVDVSAMNHPPNAVNDPTQSVKEGAGPTALDVLANDSDIDGDTYVIISATAPAHGVVTILPGGAGLTYDPAPLYHGTDTFIYTLRDTGGLIDTAKVIVTVTKDTTVPVVVAPTQRFLGQTVGTSTIKARIAWSGTDPGSGIKSYQLQVSVNGHTYTTVKLPSLTRTYFDATLTNSATYRYRVRGTDKEGNVGAYRYGPTFKSSVFQETTGLATYVGAWSTYKTTGALGGAVRLTASLGKTVSFNYTVSDIGLVMTKSATSGSFQVYVDGVLAGTINLRATKTTYRQLVFLRHFATLSRHTIELRPTGTGRVDLDAFATLH